MFMMSQCVKIWMDHTFPREEGNVMFELVCIPPGSHQCPEDREDSGGSQDKQPSQSLWVVGLHDLDDPQQRLDSWSPQVTHVQSL